MDTLLTHEDMDRKTWTPPVSWYVSRACWREIGRRLKSHPELISASRQHIQEMIDSGDMPCSPVYLYRWMELLESGMDPVIRVLTSPGDEEEQVLRSCTPRPIRLLLTPSERGDIHLKVKRELQERVFENS